jgi:hypothetical protein
MCSTANINTEMPRMRSKASLRLFGMHVACCVDEGVVFEEEGLVIGRFFFLRPVMFEATRSS